jgi:hypothetical protein
VRRWLTVLGIVLAAALAATAYARQPAPRSALGDAVGVRRGRPFSRFCGWFVRDTRLGTWPTGRVVCAWYRPVSPDRVAELDELSYHVVTRRVSRAARSWEPLSDAAWRRDVDSVRAALRAQGGVPSCGVWTRRSTSEVREYWRFPEFEIQLFTGGGMMTARTPGTREARWSVFLRGEPRRLCEGFPDPPA